MQGTCSSFISIFILFLFKEFKKLTMLLLCFFKKFQKSESNKKDC